MPANQQDPQTDRIQGHHAAGRRRHPALAAGRRTGAGSHGAFGGSDEFFDGDAAVLDLSQLVDVPEPDWRRLKQVFKYTA
jgi:hypothetical protein